MEDGEGKKADSTFFLPECKKCRGQLAMELSRQRRRVSSFPPLSFLGAPGGRDNKTLEKARSSEATLRRSPTMNLVRAARYFAGYVFSLRDQRTINVGGAALMSAILEISGADETHVRTRLVALGDAGDVAFEVLGAGGESENTEAPAVDLGQIAAFLENLSVLRGSRQKVEAIIAALRPMQALEAKYFIKLLQGDLRIGLKEGAVEDAVARLAGNSVGDVQRANMLTGDIGETALLARRGLLAMATMRLLHPLKFMLATPAADLPDVARQMPVSGFVVEDKYDGIRAQAHIAPAVGENAPEYVHGQVIEGRRVALFSRTLDEITGSFPDLVSPLAALLPGAAHGGFILDGEILPVMPPANDAPAPTSILPFQRLQPRLGRKTLPPELLAETPVAFVVYDVLFADGQVLLEERFESRRRVLDSLVVDGQVVRRTGSRLFTDVTLLDAEFDDARRRGNEGLMVKDPASIYKPGRRGREWLKIKRTQATLDVVVTAAQVGEGRRSRFLSDFTFAVRASGSDPTLLNIGKAYSGLTDAEIQELSEWFKAHTIEEFAHGKVRTVEPQIVLEVTFDRIQPSARHKGGFALRFPRILRIRTDKPPAEIDTLETVRRLAESQ
jgi:DNA ligase-1